MQPLSPPDSSADGVRHRSYQVRYVLGATGRVLATDVRTVDVVGVLEQLLGGLPAEAAVLSIVDVEAGRDIHWTRWPSTFRPGHRDPTTGRVAI